jgi:hypothetical protein
MGLDFRRRSGRIANGSKLIVPGQITTGIKVYQTTFNSKRSAPIDSNTQIEYPTPTPTIPLTPTPTPSSTNTPTPTPSSTNTPTQTPTSTNTPTPTPTPTVSVSPTPSSTPTPTPTPSTSAQVLINAIITENGEYIVVGENEYLDFTNPS